MPSAVHFAGPSEFLYVVANSEYPFTVTVTSFAFVAM